MRLNHDRYSRSNASANSHTISLFPYAVATIISSSFVYRFLIPFGQKFSSAYKNTDTSR